MRSHIFSYSQNLAKNGYFSRVGQMPMAAVPPSSLMAPELRCLTGAPLDMRVPLGGGKWHADRALGTPGWYGVGICAVVRKYHTTRRCRVARPSPADPAPGRHRDGHVCEDVAMTGDARVTGRDVVGESSAIFDRAAGGTRRNSLREHHRPTRGSNKTCHGRPIDAMACS